MDKSIDDRRSILYGACCVAHSVLAPDGWEGKLKAYLREILDKEKEILQREFEKNKVGGIVA